MRLLVTGGRFFNDMMMLHMGILQVCDLMGRRLSLVIHGRAPGADNLAEAWAQFNGIPTLPFPAAWSDITVPGALVRFSKHGMYNARAGTDRNQQMIDEGKPDAWLAMPGGTGTADMIRRCRQAGLMGLDVSA